MEKKHKLIYLEDSKSIIKTKDKIGNLYILSKDEIKEGDWFINTTLKQDLQKPYQCEKSDIEISGINNKDYCKKIIASTNKSLKIGHNYGSIEYNGKIVDCNDYLPQIPQQFIEQFITEYNKGNIINDVLVEYNCGDKNCSLFGCQNHLGCNYKNIQTIKVNTINNTINIKTVKDSFSRKELIEILYKFRETYQYASNNVGVDYWIEKNL